LHRHCATRGRPRCCAQQKPDKPIYLTLKPDLSLASGDATARALDSATGGNKDDRIFLRADRGLPYGDVMAVMNEPRAAHYLVPTPYLGIADQAGPAIR
jgi:biopolymer transport protein ExbD